MGVRLLLFCLNVVICCKLDRYVLSCCLALLNNVKYPIKLLLIWRSVVSLQCISLVIHYANNADKIHKNRILNDK